MLAIGLMCIAWALFACLDTTAKYLGTYSELPAAQVIWMRFLAQFLAMVAALGLIAVPALLRTRALKAQILRSFLMLGSTAFNFLALRHLRLDQTTTVGFLTPLMVALLAGPFLGEWIGWRRTVAIVVGFAGILIAIRPGVEHVHPAFLLALAGMLSYAVFSLVTRYLAPFDAAEVTLFYSLLAGSVIVAPFALVGWVWPASNFLWLLLLSMGFYAGLGHYLFIVAHRYAPGLDDRARSSTSPSSPTRWRATSCSGRCRTPGRSVVPPSSSCPASTSSSASASPPAPPPWP